MDLTSPNTKSSPPPPPPPSSQPEAAESTETATALPSRIQTTKHLSFTNGVLKRHQQHHHHHHHHHPIVITYKECLKNHAASLGGHALDGCGEFMPSPTATATDPTSLKCAACGCHRNFHRRDPDDINTATATNNTTAVLAATAGNNNNNNNHTATIEYQPHHRHHPPPPPTQPIPNPPLSNRSPNSSSPPPISSSYYPSAPHMLLALSGSLQQSEPVFGSGSGFGSSRKRFRTKFSQTQKEKMYKFAEKVGWKMQKRDEEIVNEFCNEVGVDRTVLKVWMHNNKNTFGKQLQNQQTQTQSATNGSFINLENNSEDKKKDGEEEEEEDDGEDNNNNNGGGGGLNRHFQSVAAVNGGGGGSSSSS